MGMAFADALVDHSDARVALVDRRHGVGGHWLEAYPFVRLHQASCFYGVPSTLLGGGRLQESGPEAGLQIRAAQPEVVAYYAAVAQRLQDTGRVEVLTNADVVGREVVSRVSGRRVEVPDSCRLVDGRYLAPGIPVETPPPFAVGEGARVLPSTTWCGWRRRPASTSSSARARPPPTPACGCWAAGSTPTPSAGSARATPGCSTARSSSPTRRCSSGCPRRSSRPPRRRGPSTRCSCGSRTPA